MGNGFHDAGLFDSRDVAAFVAQECVRNGYAYNRTKLQKLLYCACGAVLAGRNRRLCDEYPRAWDGPVDHRRRAGYLTKQAAALPTRPPARAAPGIFPD